MCRLLSSILKWWHKNIPILDMTAVKVQSNKIVSNEVKDNSALLEPLYRKKLNEFFGQFNMYIIYNTHMFITILFIIVKNGSNLFIDRWIDKMLWDVYVDHEILVYHKKNEILPFATTCLNIGSIMLSEISQIEKDRYHRISLKCGISKQKQTNNQNKTETDS